MAELLSAALSMSSETLKQLQLFFSAVNSRPKKSRPQAAG
jgi:hypothetical protein